MLKSLLQRLLPKPEQAPIAQPRPRRVPVEVNVAVASPKGIEDTGVVPVYPPSDAGLRIADPAKIVQSQEDLVSLLRKHVSLSTQDFERLYLSPINRLASYVGLLPASKEKSHMGPGGLFRFALSMGTGCARAADGVNWSGGEPLEQKRAVEDAWKLAAFLAGLCCELYRPLVEMHVFAADGRQWAPYISGLNDWAAKSGIDKYYVRWQNNKGSEPVGARASTAFAVQMIAGEELLQDLHTVSPKIVQALMGAVTGTINALEDHPLMRTINLVRTKVVAGDEAIKPQLYGSLTQGAHLEPHFLDAMRRMLKDGKWAINAKGARMHWGQDGLYLAWPLGGKELLRELQSKGTQGVPSNESTLAEMLAAAGIISQNGSGSVFFMIYPVWGPDSQSDIKMCAVRFCTDMSLLGVLEEGPAKASWNLITGIVAPAPPTEPRLNPEPPTPPPSAGPDASIPAQQNIPTSEAGVAVPSEPERVEQAAKAVSATSPADASSTTKPSTGSAIRSATQTAPERPKTAVRLPGGAIEEVEEKRISVDSIPPDIIGALGEPVCKELIVWRDAWNAGRSPKNFKLIEGAGAGLAVSLTFASERSALEPHRFQEPLKANSFLVLEEKGGKKRVLQKINFHDGEALAYVLKRAFAERCGFEMNPTA